MLVNVDSDAIAAIVAEAIAEADDDCASVVAGIGQDLADLMSDTPRFRRAAFLDRCGIEETESESYIDEDEEEDEDAADEDEV